MISIYYKSMDHALATDLPVHHLFRNLTGERFNNLFVLGLSSLTPKSPYRWICQCDCGKVTSVLIGNLKETKSCGCAKSEYGKTKKTHGNCIENKSTPEYSSWASMKSRCSSKKGKMAHNYRNRGISVCDRWINSFSLFLEDMGPKPTPRHTIERRNNNVGYNPQNCYWASYMEQGRNRRGNLLIDLDGKCLTISQWSKELNASTYRSKKILLERGASCFKRE